jgi:hypothetical protein
MTTSVKELLARARSQLGRGIKYRLGAGGMVPSASSPANSAGDCDCSGFSGWCAGVSRLTKHPVHVKFNGGWINTDAMHYDAVKRLAGFFELLVAPKPGAFVLYPGSKKKGVGHVGIVTSVDAKDQIAKVIHCSIGNYRKNGDAIAETSADVFRRPDRIICWYCGIDGGYDDTK